MSRGGICCRGVLLVLAGPERRQLSRVLVLGELVLFVCQPLFAERAQLVVDPLVEVVVVDFVGLVGQPLPLGVGCSQRRRTSATGRSRRMDLKKIYNDDVEILGSEFFSAFGHELSGNTMRPFRFK